ncbi:TfoX/Sxy family protein [Methylomonas sp. AM2-LC]|uniref:TfoX/Sxy family protein n=1 Tax=Methylomonas sp. AM2-LC TaxID=3153301 RepID=UPI0032665053
MTANTQQFVNYVLEQLDSITALSCVSFFGGIGLKQDAVQFAMAMGNVLYFVVDNATRTKYQAQGMSCFQYQTKVKTVYVNKYFTVPDDVIENQELLTEWAKEAIQIARKLKK